MQAKSCSIGVCVVGDGVCSLGAWQTLQVRAASVVFINVQDLHVQDKGGGSGGEEGTDEEEEEEEDGREMPLPPAFSWSHSSASSRVLKLFC